MQSKFTNRFKKTVLPFILMFGVGLHAQLELKSLFIDKQYENSYKTTLSLMMQIENGLDLYGLDMEKSTFTEIKDDTGFDFLKNGQGVLLNETYTDIYPENGGTMFALRLVIDGVPAKGAKTLTLKGELHFQYQGEEGNEKELTLQMPGQNYEGTTNTEIGTVTISKAGSATIGEDQYDYFTIAAPLPIKSFEMQSEDDSNVLISKGIGVDEGQFVYKEQPAQVKIQFNFADIVEKVMPLDMAFGIGF